jgi:choline kinase
MVTLAGQTLLERQLATMRAVGITDITVVVGHGAASVQNGQVTKIENGAYASTNMVESLMCARSLLDGSSDVLVSYGDIVYEARALRSVLDSHHAISVAVDRQWKKLWDLRTEDPLADAETMRLRPDGRIAELGKKPRSLAEIEGQYLGLFRIGADVARNVRDAHAALDRQRLYDGRDLPRMFMTSFLQELIDRQFDVGAAFIDGGWLEVDTISDLEKYESLAAEGRLRDYYDDRL